ncbi:TIGR01777 family protein [Leucobacter coleopterorum]|uniref:TIGR01777 family protein n=1 Tax=Leucobacter coleopterorum TaxID=2714933 RepID=A0ABX6JV16_9MICO|nr:TIGR01777 family oxidoreductase [Leucobacter coleopterorum]QIM18107.1 TIGR01777 family protein [Leucobacter coleopterorum]
MTDTHVVIAGGSGLIGGALTQALRADGVRVTRLVRRPALIPDEVEWLTGDGPLNPTALEGTVAVVGLSGASIGKLPWTHSYRETLRRSRLEPTRELARALRQLGSDAPAFLSASATGFYGSQPGKRLTEGSRPGDTFLADLCVQWERAALEAGPGTRVVHLRTAPLLDRRGVLKPLLALTRFGISGPLGSGKQVWPWISLDDEVRAIRHLIDHEVSGPVNLTGPTSATASEIGRSLAQSLQRPFVVPAPAWALRLGLGADAADSLLLPDANTVPDALIASGFEFHHHTPADAIAAALGA